MNQVSISRRTSPFAILRRLAQPQQTQERCDLCSVALGSSHRHLFETSKRRIVCACEHCAMRFQAVVGGRFKLIPRHPHALPDFHITDAQWESLALPINLAFFFRDSSTGKTTALYPSPAGATESLLALTAWESLQADNPALAQMEPDVESLLINRVDSEHKYYIAPMDICYELVGVIRMHWRGLSGGESVWKQLETFFGRLDEQCESLYGTQLEAAHA